MQKYLEEMLSPRGRAAYFPYAGILGQCAEAKNVEINATIGTAFEEDGTPMVLDSVATSLNLPKSAFLYAPSQGNPALRKSWGAKIEGTHTLPIVTNGLTHGLYVAGQLFADASDTILLPNLFWDNYELLFKDGCGASIRTFETFVGGKFNVDAIRAEASNGKSEKLMIVLNFPNNPAGYTPTESEAAEIADALLAVASSGRNVVVIIDDAYYGLGYEPDIMRGSLFGRLASLHERLLAIKLDAPTKEDYVWGARLGFITFGVKGLTAEDAKILEDKAAGIVRGTISNCSNIAQQMLIKAYSSPDYSAQKSEKYETLRLRYAEIRRVLAAHPEFAEEFEALPFNSGYFMCVRLKNRDPEATRLRLLSEFGIGVIRLSGVLRIAFSCVKKENLEKLFVSLYKACK